MHAIIAGIVLGVASLASGAPTSTGPDAAIQTVTVGDSLGFDPHVIQVSQGSIVHFDFLAVNHTLTESTFDDPCQKLADTDIDTDFNNANPGNVHNLHPFDYTFGSDKPRYFFCKQGAITSDSHCGQGEVFAVNVDEARFKEFQDKAKATRR